MLSTFSRVLEEMSDISRKKKIRKVKREDRKKNSKRIEISEKKGEKKKIKRTGRREKQ